MKQKLKEILQEVTDGKLTRNEALAKIKQAKLSDLSEPIETMIAAPKWKKSTLDLSFIENQNAQIQRRILLIDLPEIDAQTLGNKTFESAVISIAVGQENNLAKRYSEVAVACFEILKNIVAERLENKILLQLVIANDQQSLLFTGLSGLLKTAHLENPNLIAQVHTVERNISVNKLANWLLAEKQDTNDHVVRHQPLSREVLSWQFYHSTKESDNPKFETRNSQAREFTNHCVFKDHGTYLVTGGLGGIGQLFIKEILKQAAHAKIIITGRSELNDKQWSDKKRLITGGHKLGNAQLEYYALDLSQSEQVNSFIDSLQNEYGRLSGILHCAGMISDNFILNKSKEEFSKVLSPKVEGTFNLDQASSQIDIDFMVLFSSVASWSGHIGQADYAAANGFMDQFASYRNQLVDGDSRKGLTIAINWPLWDEGGMSIAPEIQAELYKNTGLIPLPTSMGLQAFYQCINSCFAQSLVMLGKPSSLQLTLEGKTLSSTSESTPAPKLDSKAVNQASKAIDLLEQTKIYLGQQLSELLKLKNSSIDFKAALEKYGIDSILAMKLTSQLEKNFGPLSKTLFFEYQTIAELAEYFVKSHSEKLLFLLSENVELTGDVLKGETKGGIAESVERYARRKKRPSRRVQLNSSQSQAKPVQSNDQSIAIVGLSGRYPAAFNLEEYWQNLQAGTDCISEIPPTRWVWQDFYTTDRTEPGLHYSKWGGFIDGVDEFDPRFFNIAPKDAPAIDPQERLFLEQVWMAVEDAGYTRQRLQIPQENVLAGQVGVYVGVMYGEYNRSGSLASIANRVSYFLNLHGPSMTLDTMCSSSLTAIHLACQDLKQGRTSLAIAGGVNISVHPGKYQMLSAGQFISSDGHCQSFGEGGDGYIPGEGVGAVVLKRLSEAERDGQTIYGVIRGSAINHGGKTNGYSVPNPKAQTEAINQAFSESDIDPRHVSYIEAHGTGTKLGDPIEIAALNQAFKQPALAERYCAIGSAKSNIGHCESAAGIAGLTKVLLQMKHKQIVPSLHSSKLNPYIDFEASPFVVNQELKTWRQPVVNGKVIPRLAGISSFGAGGANAHLIVEEYQMSARNFEVTDNNIVILLSARTEYQLQQKAQDLLKFFASTQEEISAIDLSAIAYTLQVGREAMAVRLGFIVSTAGQAITVLENYVNTVDKPNKQIFQAEVKHFEHELAAFHNENDWQIQLNQWIEEKQYTKLLDWWVKGQDVDWVKLYKGVRPSFVSLPAYPFAKESYWLPPALSGISTDKNANPSMLHSLVHNNTSNLELQRYTTCLKGDEFFLKASPIDDKKILSAAFYLEMARAAVVHASSDNSSIVELLNIQFGEPVHILHQRDMHIALFADDEKIDFEIYSQEVADASTGEEIIHCQGHAKLNDQLMLPKRKIENLKSQMIQAKSLDSIRFKSVYQGENQYLVELNMASFDGYSDFILHPSVMDEVIHTVVDIARAEQNSNNLLSCGSLRVFSDVTRAKLIWVQEITDNNLANSALSYDIELIDSSGQVCAQLQGVKYQLPQEQLTDHISNNEYSALEVGTSESYLTKNKQNEGLIKKEIIFKTLDKRKEVAELKLASQLDKPSNVSLVGVGESIKVIESSFEKGDFGIELLETGSHFSSAQNTVKTGIHLFDYGNGVFSLEIREVSSNNRLSKEVIDDLLLALKKAEQQTEIKTLIVSANGDTFLQGNREAFNLAIESKLYHAIVAFPYPIIAAIKGDALGAGCLFGALCDFMICSQEGLFSYSEASFFASKEVAELFSERFGEAQANNFLYSGNPLSGKMLLDAGWNCPILPKTDVDAYALNLASMLVSKSQEPLRLLKGHLARYIKPLVDKLIPAGSDSVAESRKVDITQSKIITSNSELLRIKHHGEHVLHVEIIASEKVSISSLLSDLAELFSEIEKSGLYRVIVLNGEIAHFLPTNKVRFSDEVIFAFGQLLQGVSIPVISAMASNISGLNWMVDLFSDGCVYQNKGRYSARNLLQSDSLAHEALMMLSAQFGEYFAKELLLSGEAYTGAELQERYRAITVVDKKEVIPTALSLATNWAKQPLDSIVSWKKNKNQKFELQRKQFSNRLSIAPLNPQFTVTDPVLIDINSNVVTLTAFPDKYLVIEMADKQTKNLFSDDLVEGLYAAFEHVAKLTDYNSVILMGYDSYFASGGTKETLLAIQEGKVKFTDNKVYQLALECSIPVIAAIQGHGIGAGWALGMFSDFIIMGEESHYVSPYMSYGFTPGAGSTLIFPNKIGYDLGRETLFTAQQNTGRDLKKRGLPFSVLPRKQVMPAAIKLAEQLSHVSRQQLIALKQQWSNIVQLRLTGTYAGELNMHELTFVGQSSILELINSQFKLNENLPDKAHEPVDNLPCEAVLEVVAEEFVDTITARLKGLLAGELHLDVDEIDNNTQFVDLGLDSITGVTWLRKINEIYHTEVEATKLYTYPTLAQLSDYVKTTIERISPRENNHSSLLDSSSKSVAISTPIASENKATNAKNLTVINALLKELLAAELHLDVDEIDNNTQFVDLGLDSITGVTWLRKINEIYHTEVEATKLYTYPTLAQLSDYVKTTIERISPRENNHSSLLDYSSKSVAISTPIASENKATNAKNLTVINALLKELLAAELHLAVDEIDNNTQFVDLGLDSITGVTWLRKINEIYHTEVEATKLYTYPTLEMFSGFVKESLPETIEEIPKSQPNIVAPISKVETKVGVNRLVSWRNKERVRKAPQGSATEGLREVAVIGMAGQFPLANNIETFWQNIAEGKDCISEVPQTRWNIGEYYQSGEPSKGKANSKWLGALENYDEFDPLFFNISPVEAENMDPQQRLFLQSCWHGIENAGLNAKSLSGTKCGVFVGCAFGDYHLLSREQQLSSEGFTGDATSILAARISYFLDLKGPCLSIDTACSSSLVAIASACDSLIGGDSDLALAGGVYVMAGPEMHVKASQTGMLSTDGKCFSFDQRANGFVIGESVGVVVLKRLADAINDNDIIQGVLVGWGVNQDGKTNGITAPNPESQTRLQQVVYDKYQIDPAEIQLIEAHGTGTKLGDPIEIEGLIETFKQYTQNQSFCAIGSVKSNIGHCLTAAGISGFIKLMLAIKHQQLPPTRNFSQLNEHVSLSDSPFFINQTLKPWELNGNRRRQAAISSFGFSGTNAHLVVAEYEQTSKAQMSLPVAIEGAKFIVPLSAKTASALKQKVRDLLIFIQGQGSLLDLGEVAYTLQVGREEMAERLGFIVSSIEQLAQKLQEYVENGQGIDGVYQGRVRSNRENSVTVNQSDDRQSIDVDKLIETKQLSKLLGLWVKGLALNWNDLYQAQIPQRICLPNYPFSKEKYWIGANSTLEKSKVGSRGAAIHPLLHNNTSDLSQQSYTSCFDRNALFLSDYFVFGQKVLPVAIGLEMAVTSLLNALPVSKESLNIEYRDITLAQLFEIGESTTIQIELFSNSDTQVDFDIYELDSDVVQFRGQAWLSESETVNKVDVTLLRKEINRSTIESQNIYQAFARMGLNFGSAYQGINEVYFGEKQLLAELRLPSILIQNDLDYLAHPSLMDSALQAAILLINNTEHYSELPMLPFTLNTFKVHAKCNSKMLAWVRFSQHSVRDEKLLDIDIIDAQGNLCVEMKGLTLQPVTVDSDKLFGFKELPANDITIVETQDELVEERPQTLMYKEHWALQPTIKMAAQRHSSPTIVFADSEISTSLDSIDNGANFGPIISITQAKNYQKLSPHAYQCRFNHLDDLQRLFTEIASDNVSTRIVYTWSKGQGESGVHALFTLFKAIKAAKSLFEHVTLVGHYEPSKAQTCWDYAWIGFERSLRLLMPDMQLSLLYTSSPSVNLPQLFDGANRVGVNWYKGEQRFTLALKRCESEQWRQPQSIKQQGYYLITGGCGMLGLKFAEHLARNYQAKLLLIGRSALTPDIEAQLARLKAVGALAVDYQSVDMSDKDALAAFAQTVPLSLSGIIHAAGVESVSTFDEKSSEALNQVLHPKTVGTVLLDNVFAQHPLDFVCYFSSSAAILGDFGSCDYAIANRFQMAYGEYRAQSSFATGKTVVINWPYWQGGGMGQGNHEQTAFYLKSSGQEALESEAGLALWDSLMCAAQTQTLVMVGQPRRVDAFLQSSYHTQERLILSDVAPLAMTTSGSGWQPSYQDFSLKECLISDLKQQVSECLKIGQRKLDEHTNLADYGFNSINLAVFAKQLTAYLGVEVTPALFFSASTIAQLSEHFLEEHAETIARFYHRPALSAVKQQASEQGQRVEKPLLRRRALSYDNVHPTSVSSSEPIAIVGMSGRFPQADSVEQLWTLLAEGQSGITEVPSSRWNWRDYFTAPGDTCNKISTNKGGFITGMDEFDPLFFEISPKEAEEMDPGERLLLMESYKAIEDARISPASLRGKKVGVFVGMEESQYGLIAPSQGVTTGGNAMVSSRLSYYLDFHGPTIAINTACSSGLVAVHQASMSIRQGECESALAAGVALSLLPDNCVKMSQAGMLSQEGECFSFSSKANGIGVGEAVAVVMLKPLSQALAAGDRIYGAIKGSGINFDGKTNGVTAPNGQMQAALIEDIYSRNDIKVETVSHIVTHGTGTKLGDPVELNALISAFKSLSDKQGQNGPMQCAVTSCKSNLGHTMAASGLVSLMSLLKGMEYGQIPASLHCEEENDYIHWKDSPFYINKKTQVWERKPTSPRRGGVSAFGRSGTNAHVVIEEVEEGRIARRRGQDNESVLLPLSAKTKAQLKEKATGLLAFIGDEEQRGKGGGCGTLDENGLDLTALAYTLQVAREEMEERVGFIVNSVEQLSEKLQAYVAGEANIADSYQGHLHASQEEIRLINQDEDMAEAIDKWIVRKKLAKLLELWVKGLTLDWQKFYGGHQPQRLDLPTYPFARERYWIEESNVNTGQSINDLFTPKTIDTGLIENIIDGIASETIETKQAVDLLNSLV